MPTSYCSTGTRNRSQIESDAFKLITVRQRELGRSLTGSEKAAMVRREFEDEARRIAHERFPRGSGRSGTIAEIVRALLAGRDVLPGVSGSGSHPTKPEGMTR